MLRFAHIASLVSHTTTSVTNNQTSYETLLINSCLADIRTGFFLHVSPHTFCYSSFLFQFSTYHSINFVSFVTILHSAPTHLKQILSTNFYEPKLRINNLLPYTVAYEVPHYSAYSKCLKRG